MTLEVLERYYDAALRPMADVEDVGPFVLFVPRGDNGFYARPRLGTEQVGARDVVALLARQRELGVPRALEWVHETTPALLPAARDAGMRVEECPLLVLDGAPTAAPADVRVVAADDPDLPRVGAAVRVGIGHPGTARGPAGVAERDAAGSRPTRDARRAEWIATGLSVLMGVYDPGTDGPVGGGSHNPRGDVTEIVGVAVLPSHRRRGLAAALTAELARHAIAHGATTVFLGAQDDDVARVYEGVGFRRVGTACIAEAD